MIGKKKESVRIEKKEPKIFKIKKCRDASTKKQTDEMLLVPSLKHKISKLGLSEKKIHIMNSTSLLDAITQFKSPRY